MGKVEIIHRTTRRLRADPGEQLYLTVDVWTFAEHPKERNECDQAEDRIGVTKVVSLQVTGLYSPGPLGSHV